MHTQPFGSNVQPKRRVWPTRRPWFCPHCPKADRVEIRGYRLQCPRGHRRPE